MSNKTCKSCGGNLGTGSNRPHQSGYCYPCRAAGNLPDAALLSLSEKEFDPDNRMICEARARAALVKTGE